jgi:CBS-domain-containing membrane protein
MAVLVDQGRLVSTVERDDVPDHLPDDTMARTIGCLTGRTIRPDVPLREAVAQMQKASRRRLAVIDEQGSFLGLLCLKRGGDGVCSDADVRRRAAGRRQEH